MNVLSLFDGMSCGKIALERAGIKVDKYFASEIDKHAIKVSQHNYPDIVQLGDVTNWKNWDLPKIDLIIGGSPCQGFSFAGKQLAFDDPRSKLFFVYVDILNHIKAVNPNVKFMLENVKMKKEFLAVISEHLGVEPVFINSALVSAQNRQRYYWCNWEVSHPEDRGIVLADILESDHVDREKSHCLDANYYKGGNLKSYFEKNRRQLVFKTVQFNDRVKGVTQDERGIRYNKGDKAKSGISELGRILKPTANYSDALTASHMPKLALNDDVSNLHYRKLTPTECEALQTVPRDYTNHVSNTQRYKMLGNGWTVDVVAHILKGLTND
jgi:DNA-cytosine methyltransferase